MRIAGIPELAEPTFRTSSGAWVTLDALVESACDGLERTVSPMVCKCIVQLARWQIRTQERVEVGALAPLDEKQAESQAAASRRHSRTTAAARPRLYVEGPSRGRVSCAAPPPPARAAWMPLVVGGCSMRGQRCGAAGLH